MVNPLAVALQGLGFGSAQVALQGLLRFIKTSAGALAGDRADVRTKRLADPATARLEALQTTDRPDQPASNRPEQADTTRTTPAPTVRSTQTNISSRPANTGGRRK